MQANEIDFIKKVVAILQTNYESTGECKNKIESLLNEADEIILKETGQRFVKRGPKTVMEAIATTELTRIS